MIVVYNTLHRRKEEFCPREPGKVLMYVCGVTPYDSLHVGHARTFLAYDMIRRYFEFAGFEVYHAQNVTDIDDKIIQRARALAVDPLLLASKYTEEAANDFDALGLLRAHIYPSVSEHIPEIISVIHGLLDKGAAYERHGSLYFDVSQFPRYGQLSHQNTEEMQSSGRIEVDENKDDPLDFALWKAAKEGEPSWPSPWGPGRPGWHIECSAMSLKYLRNGFDIHGGAIELQFPHHENEAAQSEAYTGTAPFVRYWLHSGVVYVDGKKMSKSLGNFVTVKDVLKTASPDVLRMMFSATHYRSPFDYSPAKLEEARAAWARMQQAMRILQRETDELSEAPVDCSKAAGHLADPARETRIAFTKAMEDDFNTPLALAALFDLVTESHKFLNATSPSTERRMQSAVAHCTLTSLLSVLGFQTVDGAEETRQDQTADLIDLLIDVRQMARVQKQFSLADAIRARLQSMGIVLEDHVDGTTWRRQS